MKTNILFMLVLMLSANLTYAGTLKCEGNGGGFAVPIGGEGIQFECKDERNNEYELEMQGLAVGAGFERGILNATPRVSCPFKSDFEGVYLGLKTTVVIGNFSLNPNLYVGAGVCTMDIDTEGIGVIVTIGKFRIYKK